MLAANERKWLLVLVAFAFAVRLATLGAYPLMDSTESRYAEIARKMAETGDWITPQIDYGVPFWAKPPLATWLTAASIAALGPNEFAARLPALLLLAGVGALVWRLARRRDGDEHAWWALALFATTALAFVAAGSVMTDPALVLGTTMSMAGFWHAVEERERGGRLAGAAFFAGLAIGLLAKGPVALVLIFIPITAWMLWMRRWRAVAVRLPWLAGSTLAALAVVPWYWTSEMRTPGFLEYFLVGEHWQRYVDAGWKGDLYGAAHARPWGMIWLYGFAATLPWSPLAAVWLVRAVATRSPGLRSLLADPWRVYLLLWVLTPMLFFTFAGNVLWTYALPAIPAFALLTAQFLRPERGASALGEDAPMRPVVRSVLIAGASVPLLFSVGVAILHRSFEADGSHKALVLEFEMRRDDPAARLVYLGDRPHSAEFYTRGMALRIADSAMLPLAVDGPRRDFFAIREHDLAAMPASARERLESVGTYDDYRLLRPRPR